MLPTDEPRRRPDRPAFFLKLRDRDPRLVDAVCGARRAGVQQREIEWRDCGLAQQYPNLEQYLESLARERREAKSEDREMHPAAAPPKDRTRYQGFRDAPIWEKDVLSAHAIKKMSGRR